MVRSQAIFISVQRSYSCISCHVQPEGSPALPCTPFHACPCAQPPCPLPCHRLLDAPLAAGLTHTEGSDEVVFERGCALQACSGSAHCVVCLGSAAGAQGELKEVLQQGHTSHRPNGNTRLLLNPLKGRGRYDLNSPDECRHSPQKLV